MPEEWWDGGVADFREGLTEKVTLESSLDGGKEASHVDCFGEHHCRGNCIQR